MTFNWTTISERAVANAVATLRSGLISEGKQVKRFEEELIARFGMVRPVALNSGTTALHLALVLADVKAGDEVIIPPQTFIATGMAVLMQGAVPVFADIQYETANIAPNSIRKKITRRTKAIIPVHWAGYPCDLDEISEIARAENLAVIEDAAHALGATYHGEPIGAISRFTCFSFQAIKHLTTGDGGVLCCLRPEDEKRARIRRWFCIDRDNSTPSFLGERVYDADEVGYKYHLNDLGAAIGLGNLEVFPQVLARLREISNRYRREFSAVRGLTLLESKPDRRSADWLFTMLVERRDDFLRALQSRGVPASVLHQRIDRNSVFGGRRKDLLNMDRFNDHQASVPLHAGLSDEEVGTVIATVKAGW
ncbi:MAG TPA: DegT/DnrJ/EryC1/StrS family aminotransferase [Chthoniobacterales bacterium]|jgi:perosamine synthetase|nr:DegT/DnrJ/EryC1/StrS family aminotransferase [Chthoniobacterales bacterium]